MPPADAHAGCVECHDQQTITQLTPMRTFCLSCHSSSVDHYAPKECSQCHLLSSPEAYRAHLLEREPSW
jgi:nitrate/TMAO reductase-like tetraheme cytochrome c subunit